MPMTSLAIRGHRDDQPLPLGAVHVSAEAPIVTAVTSSSKKVGGKKTRSALLEPLGRSMQLHAAILQTLLHWRSVFAFLHCKPRRARGRS